MSLRVDNVNWITDQRWQNSVSATPADVDRYQYGYDRNSNRQYRANVIGTVAVLAKLRETNLAGKSRTLSRSLRKLVEDLRSRQRAIPSSTSRIGLPPGEAGGGWGWGTPRERPGARNIPPEGGMLCSARRR